MSMHLSTYSIQKNVTGYFLVVERFSALLPPFGFSYLFSQKPHVALPRYRQRRIVGNEICVDVRQAIQTHQFIDRLAEPQKMTGRSYTQQTFKKWIGLKGKSTAETMVFTNFTPKKKGFPCRFSLPMTS